MLLTPLRRIAALLACWALLGAPGLRAQTPDYTLRISDDGRRIVRADGRPFLWLGDTAWELFHRLDREEADLYLRDRAAKGFNVIQAVVLAEFDGLGAPNALGARPLQDNDPLRPNEAYFEHVDYIVNRAEALGMYVGMLPTWGDKWNKKWGIGPEIFTPENARGYGEYLGRRYRNKPIIWILGGDRSPEEAGHLPILRAMAEGLAAGDGGAHLMTFHPMGGQSAAWWFHHDDWLDLHLFQSGHGAYDAPNYLLTAAAYALPDPKPVIDGEPRYEDHPVNWKPENGWFDDFDVRQAAYWSMLAGAAGHTYGDHNIWQMLSAAHPPVSSARTPWREAINHPGAAQMGYMMRLFASRPFLELIPDPSVLSGNPGDGAGRRSAARGRDGSFAILYTPLGEPLVVNARVLRGERFRAVWFDPRTGRALDPLPTPEGSEWTFDPPGEPGRGNDWVLVLDSAARSFSMPGAASR